MPPEAPPPEAPGDYHLDTCLHAGAASAVWRGRRRRDGLPVVVKLAGDAADAAARLRYELGIARTLQAVPGVGRCLGYLEAPGSFGLVLEDGGRVALQQLVEAGPLPLQVALQAAQEVAQALGAVHAAHVVHKDVCPANIVVRPDGSGACLIDFGHATRLGREQRAHEGDAERQGTLPYLAPEQSGRLPRGVDYRTDYYGLGTTLYALCCGEAPFAAAAPAAVLHAIVAQPPQPPRQLRPDLPAAVEAVVLKLMAKDPEARYQSAEGIVADLQACLQAAATGAWPAAFVAGGADHPERFAPSGRVYGRDAALRQVLAAAAGVRRGGAALALITGEAGVGKSSCVAAIRRELIDSGARFAGGKFDLTRHDAPYSAFTQAFGALLDGLLRDDAATVRAWQQHMREAVGAHAGLLAPLVPGIERLLALPPPPQQLDAADAQDRFALTFVAFVRALASAQRPLVLFIDDLQWADVGSLELLRLILTDRFVAHVLVIGAFRDREVAAGHPLRALVDSLPGGPAAVERLHLEPLAAADVAALLQDALRCGPGGGAALAAVVHHKTGGNPFYVGAFVRHLAAVGLLRYSRAAGAWVADVDAVARLPVTANVADFVVARLAELRPGAREVLGAAACLGAAFTVGELVVACGRSPTEVAGGLWAGLETELVLPVGDDSWLLVEALGGTPPPGALAVPLRFAHDRVQEAAYATCDAAERQRVHRRVGLDLLRRWDAAPADGALLVALVDHLNRAADGLDAPTLRRLADCNLRAGERAVAAAAYAAAHDYLSRAEAGQAALGAAAADLWFPVQRELARTEASLARYDEALGRQRRMLEREADLLRRTTVFTDMVAILQAQGHFQAALDLGLRAVTEHGVAVPTAVAPAQTRALTARVRAAVTALKAGSLPRAGAVEDALVDLLSSMLHAARALQSPFWVPLVCTAADLALTHGYGNSAAIVLASWCCQANSDPDVDDDALLRDCGHVIPLLVRAGPHPRLAGLALYGSVKYALLGREPLADCLRQLVRGHELGVATGDFEGACLAAHLHVLLLLENVSLGQAERALGGYLALAHGLRSRVLLLRLQSCQRAIACLRGQTAHLASLDDAGWQQGPALAAMAELPYSAAPVYYELYGLLAGALHGAPGEVAAIVAIMRRCSQREDFLRSMAQFWGGLWLAQLAAPALPAVANGSRAAAAPAAATEAAAALAAAATALAALARRQAYFRPAAAILAAEAAALAGNSGAAQGHYDAAVGAAEGQGLTLFAALAVERAGRGAQRGGRTALAQVLLREAQRLYGALEATAKLQALEVALPTPPGRGRLELGSGSAPARAAGAGGRVPGGQADDGAILRATQRLAAAAATPTALAEALLAGLCETLGADRGSILSTAATPPTVLASTHLEAQGALAASAPLRVVEYAVRCGQPVLLPTAAAADDEFPQDAHLARRRGRSLMCVPLVRDGGIEAVALLENTQVDDAFTPQGARLVATLGQLALMCAQGGRLQLRLDAEVAERTEQMRALQQTLLRRERQTLEVQMAGGFAHEMRNALSACGMFLATVGGTAEGVGDDLLTQLRAALDAAGGPDSAAATAALPQARDLVQQVADMLGEVDRSLAQALQITRLVLDYARLGKAQRGDEEVDLTAVVTETLDALKQDLAGRDIDVALELAVGCRVRGFRAQLGSVVSNLVLNARDALSEAPAGRPRRLHVVLAAAADGLRLQVQDSGVGMSPEVQERLFTPFFSTKPSTGTGLGLGMARKVVELYGGSISFTSAAGVGTTFEILLPRS